MAEPEHPLTWPELEIIRRSLAMSSSLPGPSGDRLVKEVERLRERLRGVDEDLAELADVIRRAQRRTRIDGVHEDRNR